MDHAPRECLGKNVMFDSDSGALFARVVDIITFNSVNGPREAFITDGMVVRNGNSVREIRGRRVLHIAHLTLKNFVSGKTFSELAEAGELDDEFFLRILAADENYQPSSFELSRRFDKGEE